MKKALKRRFEKGQHIYVVDYWYTFNGPQAFETSSIIWKVNKKDRTFLASLYGDTFKTYSFNDYNRLFFDTLDDAAKDASKLPKPQTTVYHVIDNIIYTKLVIGIYGRYTNDTYDLFIELNNGNNISTKEIGITLFLTESDAIKNKK